MILMIEIPTTKVSERVRSHSIVGIFDSGWLFLLLTVKWHLAKGLKSSDIT